MNASCDILIIGGGPGGTPAAMALASQGKRVLLVEAGQGLGGTCLFEGCIPSKIIRESVRRLRELRQAGDFGLCLPTLDIRINWSAIMERKLAILQHRSQAAVQRTRQLPGLELVFGSARFLTPHRAEVIDREGRRQEIEFQQALIATGSEPNTPPIPGIDLEQVLDSQSILDIARIPPRLLIIGGGPIGVELGQMFHSLGSEVRLLEVAPRILGPVDAELAARLQQRMIADGIDLHTGVSDIRIRHTGGGVMVFFRDDQDQEQHHFATHVLQVTGRHPRVEGLGLENTAIEHDRHGIKVDECLRTAEPHIHAAGDVLGHPMFAHWATAQSLAVARHLLGLPGGFPSPDHNSAVIFSSPELGMAGLTEEQARERGIDVGVAQYDFRQDARAQIHGDADGLLKILYDRDSRRIIGVHALVEGAGELMGEAATLIRGGVPIERLASAIHPHPTLSESFTVAVRTALAAQAHVSVQDQEAH